MNNALPDMTLQQLMTLKKELNELGEELRQRSEFWFEAAEALRSELLSRRESVDASLIEAEEERKDTLEHDYYIRTNIH